MMRFILAYLFVIESSFAGLPPTSTKGQSESGKTTTFNFEAPYNQMTETAAATRLIETGNKNLLTNPSFEHTTYSTGWTVGSYTCSEDTTNFTDGKKGGTCLQVNAAASVVQQTVTPSIALTGSNWVASMKVAAVSSGFEFCGLVAGVEVQCIPVPATGNYELMQVALAPSTGNSMGVRLKSTDTVSKTVRWDEGGVKPLVASSVQNAKLLGSISYPPTANCQWTGTSTSFSNLAADPDCGTPTVTGSLASAPGTKIAGLVFSSIPPGRLECRLTGGFQKTGTQDAAVYLRLSDGTNTTAIGRIYGANLGIPAVPGFSGAFNYTSTQSNVTIQVQAKTDNASNNVIVRAIDENLEIACYHFPDNSSNLMNFAQAAISWSGYHGTNCSFTRTSAIFGDPSGDASCDFTQQTNKNFGSVSSYQVGGNNGAGIVFTPSRTGSLYICANAIVTNTTNAAANFLRMTDGTTVFAWGTSSSAASTYYQIPVCGVYEVSSLSQKSIRIETATGAGTVAIQPPGLDVVIQWRMFYIDVPMPAPLITNSVVTPYSGSMTTAVASYNCSSSSGINSQYGNWISSVSNASSGLCTLTLNSGVFSDDPICVTQPIGATTTNVVASKIDTANVTSTSVPIYHVSQTGGTTSALNNVNMLIQCTGPK